MGQVPHENDPDYSAKLGSWVERADDLLAELLHTMGKSLGYDFDKVKIKRGIYIPKGHGDERFDQYMIRKGLVNWLSGVRPVSIKLANTPN